MDEALDLVLAALRKMQKPHAVRETLRTQIVERNHDLAADVELFEGGRRNLDPALALAENGPLRDLLLDEHVLDFGGREREAKIDHRVLGEVLVAEQTQTADAQVVGTRRARAFATIDDVDDRKFDRRAIALTLLVRLGRRSGFAPGPGPANVEHGRAMHFQEEAARPS